MTRMKVLACAALALGTMGFAPGMPPAAPTHEKASFFTLNLDPGPVYIPATIKVDRTDYQIYWSFALNPPIEA